MRPVDICILAKDFLGQHPSRQLSITTPPPRQMVFEGEDSLLSDIIVYSKQERIDIYSFPNEDVLWGMIIRGKKKSEIFYSSRLNTCWARFVVAKELCHLLIDNSEGESFTSDPVELASSLITRNIAFDSHSLNSEPLAMVMACEVMMPYSENHILSSSRNSYHIARDYGMPEKMIDFMRSEMFQAIRKEAYE